MAASYAQGWDVQPGNYRKANSKKGAEAAKRESDWVEPLTSDAYEAPAPSAAADWSRRDLQTVMQEMPANPFQGSEDGSSANIPPSFNYKRTGKGDANLELQCLKCVLMREGYLNRLYALSFRLNNGEADLLRNNDGSGLLDSLVQIRMNSVDTVAAIEDWRNSVDGSQAAPAFVWKGQNYMVKMVNDLDFLSLIKPLVAVLGIHPDKMRANPFMSALTLNELQQKQMEPQVDVDDEDPLTAEKLRIRTAEVALIREFSEQGQKISPDGGHKAQINGAQLQHTAEVLQWRSHAERQLQALRQPLQDTQLGRKGTNRLYVPKRGGPLLQPIPSNQPQTLRDLMAKKEAESVQDRGMSAGVSAAIFDVVGRNNVTGYIPDFQEYESMKKRTQKERVRRQKKLARQQQQQQQRQYEQEMAARRRQQQQMATSSTASEAADEKPKRTKEERRKMRTAQKLRNIQSRLQLPLRDVTGDHIKELAEMPEPPQVCALVAATVLILVVPGESVPADLSWKAVRAELGNSRRFLRRLRNFDPSSVAHFKVRALQPFISNPNFKPEVLQPVSAATAALAGWVLEVVNSLPDFKTLVEANSTETED